MACFNSDPPAIELVSECCAVEGPRLSTLSLLRAAKPMFMLTFLNSDSGRAAVLSARDGREYGRLRDARGDRRVEAGRGLGRLAESGQLLGDVGSHHGP